MACYVEWQNDAHGDPFVPAWRLGLRVGTSGLMDLDTPAELMLREPLPVGQRQACFVDELDGLTVGRNEHRVPIARPVRLVKRW
jgi:hypothetical protein